MIPYFQWYIATPNEYRDLLPLNLLIKAPAYQGRLSLVNPLNEIELL